MSSTSTDQLTLTVHPRYRDYLACTVTSCAPGGSAFLWGVLLLGVSLYSAANPPPNAVISASKVFLFFVVPFFLILVTMIVMMFAIHSCLHVKYASPQEIALSEQSVTFSGTTGSGILPWTSFDHYKETPWSFILWRGAHWMVLPKRAFQSWDDLSRCRELLDHHLEHSRWFPG